MSCPTRQNSGRARSNAVIFKHLTDDLNQHHVCCCTIDILFKTAVDFPLIQFMTDALIISRK